MPRHDALTAQVDRGSLDFEWGCNNNRSRVISDDLLQFIQTFVSSVWTLELLLLMRRSPDRSWSAEALNEELRSSSLIVANGLAALIAAGLVLEEATGGYCYRPVRPTLGELVDRLAATYAEFPFAVTQAILTTPNDKIRIFADAFRIKRD